MSEILKKIENSDDDKKMIEYYSQKYIECTVCYSELEFTTIARMKIDVPDLINTVKFGVVGVCLECNTSHYVSHDMADSTEIKIKL